MKTCKAQSTLTAQPSFKIKKDVRQGCVLAATLFCIYFSLLLSYAFKGTEDDIHLYTRSDGKLFNMRRLRAKSKRRKISIKELLFANDAALVAHSESKLQADRQARIRLREILLNYQCEENCRHGSRCQGTTGQNSQQYSARGSEQVLLSGF